MVVTDLAPTIFWLQQNPADLPWQSELLRSSAKISPCSLDSWPKDKFPVAFVIRGVREEVLPALRLIRRAPGRVSNTPVLLISPEDLEADLGTEEWARGVDVLVEPLNLNALARKLDFFVTLQQRSEEIYSRMKEDAREVDPDVSQSNFLDSLIGNIPQKEQERLQLIRQQAMLEERESTNQRMMFLAEASMILTASFDYRQSLKMLTEMVVPFFSDWCSIYLIRKNERPELVANRGEAFNRKLDLFSSRHATSLLHRRPEEFVASERKSIFEIEAGVPGIRSFLSVPIQVRGEVLGVLQFATSEVGRAFGAEDLSTAEELGRRAGIAIDNAQLYETAQKAIQARDEFLSIASHELKTPMTSLKLQVQMTRRMVDIHENKVPSAARLAKVLDISAVQVDRINALVDDLLDVSRIESGKLTYEFERIEVGHLVREMVERYFENLRSAGCQVTVETSELVWVKGDRFRLEQVVLNLLSNAAKYGRARPVNLSVKCVGGMARVEMRDHGIGIAPDMLDKVFERFERASPSGHIGGLGLGLYICREIVRAHGGNITIASEVGNGSTFTVDIPLSEAITETGLFTSFGGKNSQSYLPLAAIQEERLAQ